MSINTKLTAIADNVRTHTGRTELLNLDQMAEGVNEVYYLGYYQGEVATRQSEYDNSEEMTYTPSLEEQVDERIPGNQLIKKVTIKPATEVYEQGYNEGKKSEYDTFWDTFQNNGKRTNYAYAFSENSASNTIWTAENFRPKYDLMNITGGRQLFAMWQNEESIWNYKDGTSSSSINLTKWFDTLGIKFNTSRCTDFTQMFYYATRIVRIPPLDIRNAEKLTNMFLGNSTLRKIDKLIVNENTDFSSCGFNSGLPALENIDIEGTIGKNFNIQGSSKLTHDSLMSIINALADKTSDTSKEWVLTIGANNKAKLTENELSEAYTKGWAVN